MTPPGASFSRWIGRVLKNAGTRPRTGLSWQFPRAGADRARVLALLVLVHTLIPHLRAGPRQESPSPAQDLVARVKSLRAEEKWDEILQVVPASPNNPPDLDYYRGMALSRKERWQEAREAFEAGQKNAPEDKRFPIELAGVAYRQHAYSLARAHVARGLGLDPGDTYGNDFLVTL